MDRRSTRRDGPVVAADRLSEGDAIPAGLTLWRPRSLLDWVDHLLFGRGHYPESSRDLIRADALALLREHGDGEAYAVAGERTLMIDPGRPEGHWRHVRQAIAEHLGLRVGGSGCD